MKFLICSLCLMLACSAQAIGPEDFRLASKDVAELKSSVEKVENRLDRLERKLDELIAGRKQPFTNLNVPPCKCGPVCLCTNGECGDANCPSLSKKVTTQTTQIYKYVCDGDRCVRTLATVPYEVLHYPQPVYSQSSYTRTYVAPTSYGYYGNPVGYGSSMGFSYGFSAGGSCASGNCGQ